ncbi:alanine racemase [Halieaceae bacterium IMCC14734]|uniref:Alanine racemase n=1 Tax=Candidatus Litorirhabdus singularis TaxID=2518993 RepID=A0ABT3TGX7_9GAMM|nr:alanine racemase [Candidatus Litorirhabdus singularis]MCX2981065.1 alanine racemase [Candidatus Litorirhabdus singularis]
MSRPTRAIIDLTALRHNYELAQQLTGGGLAMPIVKANAYGHGAILVASQLDTMAPAFGVACIEEAMELRAAGINSPILLLEGFFSEDELQLAAQHNFWLMVQNRNQLAALATVKPATPLTVWLKLDTGMHRLGFDPAQAARLHAELQSMPAVADNIVIATHFACADDLDNTFTDQQIAQFQRHTQALNTLSSLANSPALLGWPQARSDWNRPGFMLYGQSPFSHDHPLASRLKPVMTFRSEVMALREIVAGDSVGYANSWTAQRNSRIATVPVGYGDGYPRHAANSTPVLINGQRARLVGRVSMDLITVDVTDLGPVAIGDEVILWGKDLSANEVASYADTIGYEILTRLHNRVPRVIATSQAPVPS